MLLMRVFLMAVAALYLFVFVLCLFVSFLQMLFKAFHHTPTLMSKICLASICVVHLDVFIKIGEY